MQADIVVKSVMIGLAFASVVTWTVWLAKAIELAAARRRVRKALRRLNVANSIAEAASLVDPSGAPCRRCCAPPSPRRAPPGTSPTRTPSRSASPARLERIELAAGRDINRGTGLLATIGSTAPFIGLFGTVWGIMNSFIGISKAQTTNLAVVAPGIAEALLATAVGLVRRHPGGDHLQSSCARDRAYQGCVADASAEVLRIVSRDLDRAGHPAAGESGGVDHGRSSQEAT